MSPSNQPLICTTCQNNNAITEDKKCFAFCGFQTKPDSCQKCGHKKKHHKPPPPEPKKLNIITLLPAYCISCQEDYQTPSDKRCAEFQAFKSPDAHPLVCQVCGHKKTDHKILDPAIARPLELFDDIVTKQNQKIIEFETTNQQQSQTNLQLSHQIQNQNQKISNLENTNEELSQQIKTQNQKIDTLEQTLEQEKRKNQKISQTIQQQLQQITCLEKTNQQATRQITRLEDNQQKQNHSNQQLIQLTIELQNKLTQLSVKLLFFKQKKKKKLGYQFEKGQKSNFLQVFPFNPLAPILKGQNSIVHGIAFTPKGQTIASASLDKRNALRKGSIKLFL